MVIKNKFLVGHEKIFHGIFKKLMVDIRGVLDFNGHFPTKKNKRKRKFNGPLTQNTRTLKKIHGLFSWPIS